jgi:hypothetical protein
MNAYREAAVTLWGAAGACAHDAYARWLHLYPELPEQVPIVIGITGYSACAGFTRPTWGHGPRITMSSLLFEAGAGHVEDTMVHEMLHVWLHLTDQDTDHDSRAWYAALRRLSPAVLGRELDVRRGADRRSVRVPNPAYAPGNGEPKTLVRKIRVQSAVPHGRVAAWPSPFRPAGYDWGAPIPCPIY